MIGELGSTLFIMSRSFMSSPVITNRENVAAIVHKGIVYTVDITAGIATIMDRSQSMFTGVAAESWAIALVGPNDYIVISSEGRGIPHDAMRSEVSAEMRGGLQRLVRILDGINAPDLKNRRLLDSLQEAMGLGSGAKPIIADYISEIEAFKTLIESKGPTEPAIIKEWIAGPTGKGEALDSLLRPRMKKVLPPSERPAGIIEAELRGVIFRTPASQARLRMKPDADIQEAIKTLKGRVSPIETQTLSEIRAVWNSGEEMSLLQIKDRLLGLQKQEITHHNVEKVMRDALLVYGDLFEMELKPRQDIEAFNFTYNVLRDKSEYILEEADKMKALLKKYPLHPGGLPTDVAELFEEYKTKYASKTMFIDIETVGLADKVPMLPYEIGIQIGNEPGKTFRLRMPTVGDKASIWSDYLKVTQQFQGLEYAGKLEDITKEELETFIMKRGPKQFFAFTPSESELLVKQMAKAGIMSEGRAIGEGRKVFVAPSSVDEIISLYEKRAGPAKYINMEELLGAITDDFARIGITDLKEARIAGHGILNFDLPVLKRLGWNLEFGAAYDTLQMVRQLHGTFSKATAPEMSRLLAGLDTKGMNARFAALERIIEYRSAGAAHTALSDVEASRAILETMSKDPNVVKMLTKENVALSTGQSTINLGDTVIATEKLDIKMAKRLGLEVDEIRRDITTIFDEGIHGRTLRYDKSVLHPDNPMKFMGIMETGEGRIGYVFDDLMDAGRTIRISADPKTGFTGMPVKVFGGTMGDISKTYADRARRMVAEVSETRLENLSSIVTDYDTVHKNMQILADKEKYALIDQWLGADDAAEAVKRIASVSADGRLKNMLVAKNMFDMLGARPGDADEALALIRGVSDTLTTVAHNAISETGDTWYLEMLERLEGRHVWERMSPAHSAGPGNTESQLARTFLSISETVDDAAIKLSIKMSNYETMHNSIIGEERKLGEKFYSAFNQRFGTDFTELGGVVDFVHGQRNQRIFHRTEDIKFLKDEIRFIGDEVGRMAAEPGANRRLWVHGAADVLSGRGAIMGGAKMTDPALELLRLDDLLQDRQVTMGGWQRMWNDASRRDDLLLRDFLVRHDPIKSLPGQILTVPDELMRPIVHTGRSRIIAAMGLATAMIGLNAAGSIDPTFGILDEQEDQASYVDDSLRDRSVHVNASIPTERMSAIIDMIHRDFGISVAIANNLSPQQVAQTLGAELL